MRDSAPARHPYAERRRSSRIDRAVPVTVAGVDAVGQPFKERTTTVNISCHGFRYQSKHYILKDSSVTVEIPNPDAALPARTVKARIRWVERSKTMREPFQINAEFETPGNFWGLAFPPQDWLPFTEGAAAPAPAESKPQSAPAEEALAEKPAEPEAPKQEGEVHVFSWPEAEAPSAVPAKEPAAPAAETPLPGATPPVAQAAPPPAPSVAPPQAEGPPLRRALDRALLTTLAEEARPLFDELTAQAVKRVSGEIAAAAKAAQERWAQKIEANLAATEVQWQQRFQKVLEGVLKGASERLQKVALAAGERERLMVARVSGVEQALVKNAGEAQQRLESLRDALQREMTQVAAALEKIHNAETQAGERAALLERSAQAALEESQRRFAALVAQHNAELDQRSKGLAAEMNARWARGLESAERGSVARMVAQVEQQLAPHLGRAEQVAKQLAAGGEINEATVRAHSQRLREAAEDALHEMIPQFQQAVEVLRGQFQQATQDTLRAWLAEADAKSIEVAHTTFESLYKASEWYQKKTQAAMQAALDKGVEETRSRLRESAGEVSRLFASELDHYSRSYIEHTQQSLEETVNEVVSGAHERLDGEARAVATGFGEQVRGVAEQNLQQFTATTRAALDETSAQLNTHIAQARQEWAGEMAAFMEAWRGERSKLQGEWLDALAGATREAVQQYQQQLEKVAGDSMTAGLNSLRGRCQGVIDQLAEAAEKHLRETCSRVFAGVADSLRSPRAPEGEHPMPRLVPDPRSEDPR